MTKRISTQTAYLIGKQLVVLERITNDRNGNPRYKAYITDLEEVQQHKRTGAGVAVYTFQGSLAGERESAVEIAEHHISKGE